MLMQKISKKNILASSSISILINYLYLCGFSRHNVYELFAILNLLLIPIVSLVIYLVVKLYNNITLDIIKNQKTNYVFLALGISGIHAFSLFINPILIATMIQSGAFLSRYELFCGILYLVNISFLGSIIYYLIAIDKRDKAVSLLLLFIITICCVVVTKRQIEVYNLRQECNNNNSINKSLTTKCFVSSSFFSTQEKYDFQYKMLTLGHNNNDIANYGARYVSNFLREYDECLKNKCKEKDGLLLMKNHLTFCTKQGDVDCAVSLLGLIDKNYISLEKNILKTYFDKYKFCSNANFQIYSNSRSLEQLCEKK